MRIITILITGLITLTVAAQNSSNRIETIKGKVINEATNEGVPFTNISIEGTFHGAASDEEGEFELKIPEEMRDDQIQFSAVGYKSKKFPVNVLFNREYSIIKLEPQSYNIEDVDIAARSKVLIRILRMAAENTRYNYISGPFNLGCTYENKKVINDTTEVTHLAELLLYDKTGYTEPSMLNAFRARNYKIVKSDSLYTFSSGILNMDEILGMDMLRSGASVLNPSLLYLFDLKMKDEVNIDGKSAWIISFRQADPTPAGSLDFHASVFEGEITIMQDDYSVKKIEGRAESGKHNRQGKFLAVGPANSNYYADVSYNFSITYTQLKPGVITLNKKYRYNGQQTEEQATLTVDRVQITDVEEIAGRDYFAE